MCAQLVHHSFYPLPLLCSLVHLYFCARHWITWTSANIHDFSHPYAHSPTGYFSGHSSSVTLKTRLGYTQPGQPYNPAVIASSYQDLKLYCNSVKHHTFRGQTFDCSPQVLAVLFSLQHEHYLLNLLIPTRRDDTNKWTNRNLGLVTDVYVTVGVCVDVKVHKKQC